MRNLKNLLVAVGLIAVAGALMAATQGRTERHHFTGSSASDQFAYLNDICMDDSAANRTATITTGARWSKLLVGLDFHTQSAATAVTATVTCALHSGGTFFDISSREISSGTATVDAFSDSNAVSGAEANLLEYGIEGCEQVKVLVGSTSGGASDCFDLELTTSVGR